MFTKSQKISLAVIASGAWPLLTRAAEDTLANPFGNESGADPVVIIARIIQAMLGVVGAVTLLVFIYGGFKMIFSGGNEEKITKARSTLMWAVIGLAVILSSYAILDYSFTLFEVAASA